uniref:Phosphatidylcholine:ceramide n=1 Tax=Haemonchus contortus TaxID=6289 RepID=W6NCS5_HAECO
MVTEVAGYQESDHISVIFNKSSASDKNLVSIFSVLQEVVLVGSDYYNLGFRISLVNHQATKSIAAACPVYTYEVPWSHALLDDPPSKANILSNKGFRILTLEFLAKNITAGEDETFTIHIPLQHMNEREYKPERFKTLLVMICFLIVGLINHFVLAVVTDIISQLPLPDFAHSIIPQNDFLRHMGDFFTAAAGFLLILICCVFHKHRICVPPNPDPHPTVNSVLSKFLSVSLTFGLQVQMTEDKLFCGDMLFSGHTTAISTSCFFLNYYTPHSLWPLKVIAIASCVSAMICVVISRVHYSVDVVMGYWISSIIFSIYHGFCEIPHVLRSRNRPFRRLFLFWTMFELERHVPEGRIPNKLEWPLPWPKVSRDGSKLLTLL